jgi:periplasmic protein CpxP/Spy
MSLKSKISSTITLAFALVAFATFASAQDAAKTGEDSVRKLERHREGRHGGRGMGRHDGMRGGMFGLRGIELTDAQKEQIRQIHEANKPTEAQMAEVRALKEARKSGGEITEAQRAQMKAFHEQMRVKHESVKAQVLAILTPEQRQQIETQKAEREKMREQRRQQRQERKAARDAAKPTTDDN